MIKNSDLKQSMNNSHFVWPDNLVKEKKFDKLEIISVADVFGESIKRIVQGTSLSSLFQGF